jgi:uncharacterized protein
MDAASLLRNARVDAGLTQDQLAKRAGTSQAAVARYERGRSSPSVDTLTRLLAVCGRLLTLSTKPRREVDLSSPRFAALRQHRGEIYRLAADVGATNVRVFGSVVRGEDDDDSDIDLLVDFDTRAPDGLWPLVELKGRLDSLLGEDVDVVPTQLLKPEVARSALAEAVAL